MAQQSIEIDGRRTMSGSNMEVDPDSSNESNDETSEAAVDGEAVVAEVT